MERTLAAALAAVAVLAVALPGPAAVASGPLAAEPAPAAADAPTPTPAPARLPVEMPNTTAKLALPGGDRPGAGVAGADFGAAVAMDRRTTAVQLATDDFERRFAAADSDEERAAVIREGLDRVESRTRTLRAIEQRAYRQYAAGNSSLRSLLLTLARVDTEARLYRDRMRLLADRARDVPGVSLQIPNGERFIGRAGGIYTQLETLTGPVRRHVARTYQGRADGGLVYVAAADEGVVLAAMVDGTYVREAFRADRIEPGASQPIDIRRIAREAYPWTWDHQTVNRVTIFVPSIGVHRLSMGHTQGQLLAYVDSSSESVYREVQWLSPGRLPNVRTTSATDDGLEVTVNRTFPGGPLEVTVVDGTTGQPVDAAVTVGSHRVGGTGADGALWTVAPRGAFTVTATRGPSQVDVSVPATEFPTSA